MTSRILNFFQKLFLSFPLLLSLIIPSFGESPKDSKLKEAIAFFEKGNSHSKNNNFDKAILAYQKSIKINPNLGSVHYNLANVYTAVDKLDAAISEYKKAISLDPKISDFHRNLGLAYALKKDGINAKKKYEELKEMDPVQAEVLFQWIQKGNEVKK